MRLITQPGVPRLDRSLWSGKPCDRAFARRILAEKQTTCRAARPTPFGRWPWHPIAPILAAVIFIAAPAFGQLRIVTCNVARLAGDPIALRDVLAAAINDDKPGYAVAPAAFVFQEVRSSDLNALGNLLNAAAGPGIQYVAGTFTSSVIEDGSGGAQAMFYRPDILIEIPQGHRDIFTGANRNADRWQMTLVGYDSPDAVFYLYGAHLRAGDDPSDIADRLFGAQAIRDDADVLPAAAHVVFAGDFNLSDSTEPAYAEFLSPGAGQAIDPLGTASWFGPGAAIKHTQSPRTVSHPDLVNGGMDDRFDFQLPSTEFHDGAGLAIIAGPFAYRALGNDGMHFNTAINNGTNFYYPDDLPASNALADDLHDASDHLPVIVDYQIPAVMEASMPASFGTVIQGADVSLPLSVTNAADAVAAIGADELEFQIVTEGALTGSFMGAAAAASAPMLVQIPIDTAAVGQADGLALVTSSGQAVQDGSALLAAGGIVVRPSNASFSSARDLDAASIDLSYAPDSGVHAIEIDVHNFGYDAQQARLDIDAVGGLAAPFALAAELPTGIGAEPGGLVFSFNSTGLSPGGYSVSLSISVSDEDLPGESSSIITLDITITIGDVATPADLNGDGVVNGLDLGIMLANWSIPAGAPGCGGAMPCSSDLNGDGVVDGLDLGILLANWTI